jgi:hypothetical protein
MCKFNVLNSFLHHLKAIFHSKYSIHAILVLDMYLLKALNVQAWYLGVLDNLPVKLFSCMEVDNLKDVNYP